MEVCKNNVYSTVGVSHSNISSAGVHLTPFPPRQKSQAHTSSKDIHSFRHLKGTRRERMELENRENLSTRSVRADKQLSKIRSKHFWDHRSFEERLLGRCLSETTHFQFIFVLLFSHSHIDASFFSTALSQFIQFSGRESDLTTTH